MSEPVVKKPSAAMVWVYRVTPRLPKVLRPKGMIILHHTGRRTGQPRTTGLQSIYQDTDSGRYFVAAAYGPTSDWWRNVVANPLVTIEVDGGTVSAVAEPVDPQESVTIMEAAIEENPRLRDRMFKHAGVDVSDSEGVSKVLAVNPLMSFRVSQPDQS